MWRFLSRGFVEKNNKFIKMKGIYYMEIETSANFDNPVVSLITEWKNKALAELNSFQRYVNLLRKKRILEDSLNKLFDDETRKIFNDYLEIMNEMNGIEFENLIINGITYYLDMNKCFDSSTSEHKQLLKDCLLNRSNVT